jgi:hypothetical protein
LSPQKKTHLASADQVIAASPVGRAAIGKGSPQGKMQGVLNSPNSGFQAAVLERLKSLCGEHDDAKVLAEYIVVMVAGNKGREDMASEMKPFFSDQAQADSFVEWVEECKWKFLTGGPSPMVPKAGSPQQGKVAVSPTASAGLEVQRVPARVRHADADQRHAVRPGPHVAVTSRVVLQPNPNFDSDPAPATHIREAPPPLVKTAVASPGKPGGFSKVGKSSGSGNPVKREKNELLENMTRQLQTILTKLSDRNLNDETREKYQALAQNIQTQMAKISKPQAPPRRR